MSLLFGYHSTKANVDQDRLKPALANFSLHGRRTLKTESGDNFFFSTALTQPGVNNIAENKDKNRVLLFGGEIFDFKERADKLIRLGHEFADRNSPAELLLHSYEEYGESFVKDINGTFSLAIYDKQHDELALINDSFGTYPLFIYNSDECCIFCTEYEPITKHPSFDKTLDLDAIAEFFTFGLSLANKTFFKHIRNLQPGSVLKKKDNRISLNQYDDLDIQIENDKGIDYHADKISDSISRAVRRRIKEPRNMKCALTGGADTRLMAGIIPEIQRTQMTFRTERSFYIEDSENQDVIIAKMVAEKLNLNHIITDPSVTISQNTDEFGVDFFDKRRVTSEIRPFGGWYGSQFMGGKWTSTAPIRAKDIRRSEVHKKLNNVFSKSFRSKISDPFITLTKEIEKIKAENNTLLFAIHQINRGFFTNIFNGSRSGWLDPYSFITRFETPFCDTYFLKDILTVPDKILLHYKLYNRIYKNHYPELAKIPTNSNLAKKVDSAIPLVTRGSSPLDARRPKYDDAFKEFTLDLHTWNKRFYSAKFMLNVFRRTLFKRPFLPFRGQGNEDFSAFIDFEAWYRKFV